MSSYAITQRASQNTSHGSRRLLGLAGLLMLLLMGLFAHTIEQSVQRGEALREGWKNTQLAAQAAAPQRQGGAVMGRARVEK